MYLVNLVKSDLLLKILLNNFQVISINILGFLTFGGLTLINTSYNGFVLGIFLKVALNKTSVTFIINSFLPHSIEIVGIIYSSYIGYNLSKKMYIYIFREENNFNIKDLKQILLCYLIIVVSSILEVYVSIS